MSMIRQGQSSEYVDIHDGSMQYIYGTGHNIDGVGTYGEFIDALCKHAEHAKLDRVQDLEQKLVNHYGERRDNATAIGFKPEMAHIIAQHLDSRLDNIEYTDADEQALREYAESAYDTCTDCGDKWRDTPFHPDSQDGRCDDCYADYLKSLDVSADVGEMIEYAEIEIPENIPPDPHHDDEFYALAMQVFADASGERRMALQHQMGEITDEVVEAVSREETVDTDALVEQLEAIDEG